MIKNGSTEKAKVGSRLEHIRDAHKTRKSDKRTTDRMEDYLEVIYELIQHKGYATSTDVAECLNISRPSVTKMMRRLDETGLLDYEKYRGMRLTEKGGGIAETIHQSHGIVSEFLKMIGVDKNIANMDAEQIEHHVHPETLRKLQDLLARKRLA